MHIKVRAIKTSASIKSMLSILFETPYNNIFITGLNRTQTYIICEIKAFLHKKSILTREISNSRHLRGRLAPRICYDIVTSWLSKNYKNANFPPCQKS